MKRNQIQLMLYGQSLENFQAKSGTKYIDIVSVHYSDNEAYAFVDVIISDQIEADTYQFTFSKDDKIIYVDFPVWSREKRLNRHQGFNQADIIYLITPDRFVNGNTANDRFDHLRDKHRKVEDFGRQGGDIRGMIDKLDYLKDLGITALWINPLIENNMAISYHGYAATDLYRIDSRFGNNQLYREFVHKAQQKGLKVIMDHVSNHIGIHHPWMSNLPFADWINGSVEKHLSNHHKKELLQDVHGDSLWLVRLQEGWFDDVMPDLNQKNPFLANYLIQNTIWWIEFSGIDGIREDTYPYADQRFLARWARAILDEYPDFNIVGEVWIPDPVFLAPYQQQSFFDKGFDSYLPSVTDFGLFEAFGRIFNREQSIYHLYYFLSKDFLYPRPDQLLIFLDNHDVMRVNDLVNGNLKRFKQALQLLLTLRGIPQIYYGTELALPGKDSHEAIRTKFPGGFADSQRNAFSEQGRTAKENELWQFLRNMINLRKENSAFANGSFVHMPPEDEFYVYLRENSEQRLMMIVNNHQENRIFPLNKVAHHLNRADVLVDLKSKKAIKVSCASGLAIPGYDVGIYQIVCGNK